MEQQKEKTTSKNNHQTQHNKKEPPTITLVNNQGNNQEKKKKQNKRKRIRKNKTLTIAAININGIKGKIRSLETLMESEEIGIALITETKLQRNEKINIKGYKWIGKNRDTKKGGGVGLLVANHLATHVTEDTTSDEYPNLETKWVTLECRPKNISIGVFYGPQENNPTDVVREIYQNLETQIKQKSKGKEIILGGDFNAKLKAQMGQEKQEESRNGKILQGIINNTEMDAISTRADYGFYTRVNRKKPEEKSMIDYMIVTPTIAKNTNSIIIDEEGAHRVRSKVESDHNTILMEVKINDPRTPEYIEKWKLNNQEGWNMFNQKMEEIASETEFSTKTYNEAANIILNTLKRTVGKQKIRTDKIPKPKTPTIEKARKEKKEAKRQFENACKMGNSGEKIKTKEIYQETQSKLRKELEQHELQLIEKRIKELNDRAKRDPNTIWQARKKAKMKSDLEYNTITEEGEVITDPQKAKQHIANYFKELYQARPGTPEYETWTNHITETVKEATGTETQAKHTQGSEPITLKELNKAIRKLKRRKSLGPDDFPNEMFIEGKTETRKTYLHILNKIHRTEEIPESWLQGIILRLYKGKGLKGKCSNERGITLASNIGKVYERIINERVKKHVKITTAQAGGIQGSATADHLIALKQTIQEIKMKNKTAYIVFLDVQKAYDKAWLDAILYVLHKNGVEGKNLKMVQKLNNKLTARIQTRHGLTDEIPIRDSIRQGGVLSVVEYATLIDEISKELKNRNLGIETATGEKMDSLLWMDDVCLIHYDLEILQEMLNITNHVAKKYHIEFGAPKCKVVKIGNGPKSKITLNGQVLDEVNTYKYLGEMINNKGNLEAHIKELDGKILAATQNILTETGNKEFKGMKMEAIWQLTEAIILPIITYGAEGWDPTKREMDQLQVIFNRTLKNLLFLPQQTPTSILLAETGFLPLHLYIQKKRIMQAHRVGKKDKPLIKRISESRESIWKKKTDEIIQEYGMTRINLQAKSKDLGSTLNKENRNKFKAIIEQEALEKTKTKHWLRLKNKQELGCRPDYINKLNRKQCNAIITIRSSMLPVKVNQKSQYKTDQKCRFCNTTPENQKHVLTECQKIPEDQKITIPYEELFLDDNWQQLKVAAESIIKLIHTLKEPHRDETVAVDA